jgi:hypothetical protein
MARNYKELRNCRMCNKRFVVKEKKEMENYQQAYYCPECFEKYIKNRKRDEEEAEE